MTDDDGLDPREVELLRRGLALVAADAPSGPAARPRTPRWPLLLAAAAALVPMLVFALTWGADPARPPGALPGPSPSPTPTVTTTPPSLGIGAPTLADRVAGAERIVLGTVTSVERRGATVVVRIAVEEAFKPAGDTREAVVFTDAESGEWRVGARELYFLAPDLGPTGGSPPPHHVPAERFPVVNGEVEGPFTLAELRAATAG